ncbi:hypothetical protein M426DRAFT_325604 [Hypoxylon sp. CI-4A]|nr:hypothetical protein M426DRAFT_325604 [Hypoxylon sp. CI-4A]
MPRPKKSDMVRPTPVAPAPAIVPMAMQPAPVAQQMAPQPIQQQQPLGVGAGIQPPRTIGIEEFIRVRDSVHARFNTITGLMKSFSDDFLRQTNLLIGEPAPFDNGASHSMQNLIANLDGFSNQLGDFGGQIEEKKERKKRTHDPNAPKRPLTPYFLYMQTARPIIANDLGQDAPKGAVQEEGQRRWASMTPSEKNAWNNAYQFNLRLYNARVHSYKAGNPDARNMSDPEALSYADANGIPHPVLSSEEAYAPNNDQDAIAEQLQMAVGQASDVEPIQTPKGKVTRKRKSAAAELEEGESSAAKNATPASPDKKRKRASKIAETPEEPKKSSRKKKN